MSTSCFRSGSFFSFYRFRSNFLAFRADGGSRSSTSTAGFPCTTSRSRVKPDLPSPNVVTVDVPIPPISAGGRNGTSSSLSASGIF